MALTAAGLVTREPRGNQVWFTANQASPVFGELKALIAKTAGLADAVERAMAKADATRLRLRGSVLRHDRPLKPVIDSAEWEMNR